MIKISEEHTWDMGPKIAQIRERWRIQEESTGLIKEWNEELIILHMLINHEWSHHDYRRELLPGPSEQPKIHGCRDSMKDPMDIWRKIRVQRKSPGTGG